MQMASLNMSLFKEQENGESSDVGWNFKIK